MLAPVARVLIVDPEPMSRELHSMALGFVGHEVRSSASSYDADLAFDQFRPDVVVVSVDGGPEDGTRFRDRLIRASDPVPQIVLAATGSGSREGRRPAGAVASFARPVSLDDLVAAVGRAVATDEDQGPDAPLAVGSLSLDRSEERAWLGDAEVRLSPTEYRLLRLLMINADRVISKADILDHVWHYDFGGRTNAVETYVSYLRRKLRPLGGPSIVTVRGSGYVLRS
jgi:two-component system OmpR family response regulator